MPRESELLEREIEQARSGLACALDELRARATVGQIVDELVDYARQTPMADFARNLAREIRENPLPILLIFAGVAWAFAATVLSQGRNTARPIATTGGAAVEAVHEIVQAEQRELWEVTQIDEPVE
ncbi:MAG: DUF3618 domain-containing protein [Alphaproteobacteria bacterium]|nr:DUF3618 domain-containing protein [Alphaproteobacteria bacterium]